MHESGTSVYVSRKTHSRKRKATGDKRGAEGESASGEDGTVKPATAATSTTRAGRNRPPLSHIAAVAVALAAVEDAINPSALALAGACQSEWCGLVLSAALGSQQRSARRARTFFSAVVSRRCLCGCGGSGVVSDRRPKRPW